MSPFAGSSSSLGNLYEILDVSPQARLEDIGRAFRRQALLHHPDRHAQDREAPWRFQRCAEAFSVLRDEDKRKRYDQEGVEDLEGFRLDEFHDMWFQDLLMDGGVVDDLMREVAPVPGSDDFMEQFTSAQVSTKQNAEGNTTFVCNLCNTEAPSSRFIMQHFQSKHREDAQIWAQQHLQNMKSSFMSFMRCCADVRIESRSFVLPDGSTADLPGAEDVPFIGKEIEREFGLAMMKQATAKGIGGPIESYFAPVESTEMSADFSEGLATLEDMEPDIVSLILGEVSQEEQLKHMSILRRDSEMPSQLETNAFGMPRRSRVGSSAESSGGQSRRSRRGSALEPKGKSTKSFSRRESQDGGYSLAGLTADNVRASGSRPSRRSRRSTLGNLLTEAKECTCICGFTCGTLGAFQKHLARFPNDPAHQLQFIRESSPSPPDERLQESSSSPPRERAWSSLRESVKGQLGRSPSPPDENLQERSSSPPRERAKTWSSLPESVKGAAHQKPSHDGMFEEAVEAFATAAGLPEGQNLSCVCGFTCGTTKALKRHLEKFKNQSGHGAVAVAS